MKNFSAIILFSLLLCFAASPLSADKIDFIISEGVPLEQEELVQYADNIQFSGVSEDLFFEIVIYYFSPGYEFMSVSDSGASNFRFEHGKVKSVLKIKKDDKLKDVIFFEAEGPDREAILKNFVRKLMEFF